MSGDRNAQLATRPRAWRQVQREEDGIIASRRVDPSAGRAAITMMSLQRAVGNQAVLQLLREGGVAVQRISFAGIGKAIKKAFKGGKPGGTVQEWLDDPKRYPYFAAYCRRTFNHEMINFLAAVADYKLGSQSMNYARAIYTKYVAANAPEELNITSAQRDSIKAELDMGKRPRMPIDLFDELVKHVVKDLADPFSRFIQDTDPSGEYQAYLRGDPVPA